MRYDDSNMNSTIILTDNQVIIKMNSNFINYFQAKHIDTLYYYIQNKIEEKAIKLKYILID